MKKIHRYLEKLKVLGIACFVGICAAAQAQPARVVTFVVNTHDWVNIEESAETLSFVMDSWDEAGVRGEFYLTAPYTRALVAKAPEVVERLKISKHTVSYHIRPPHPTAFKPTQHFLDTHSLLDYETYKMDLTTGDLDRSQPGGYTYVEQVFGRSPCAVGARLTDEFTAVFAKLGARMGIFSHGPAEERTGIESLEHSEKSMYPRPSDYFLARTDIEGHPVSGQRDNFWWNRVAEEQLSVESLVEAFRKDFLEASPPPGGSPLFCVVVIHENNFFLKGSWWTHIYYEDEGRTIPLTPPYDLDRKSPWITPRSEMQKKLIREAWTALVQAAASSDNTAVVTSEDIVTLAEKRFNSDMPSERAQD